MKILRPFLLASLFFATQTADAHGDHEHQEPRAISESVALIIAQRATTSMSKKDAGLGFGQLNDSWSERPKIDLSMHKQGKGYYVVSVLNSNEEKTVYVLMSNFGEVYDANFIGEFNGIE
ncbi:MAG: putative carbohydrate-binding protein with CBM5 and CBM33 domain [Arenicella sp.]|jgi:predicted carbohydrate-binding protein with CBM5 and CBM33 domain